MTINSKDHCPDCGSISLIHDNERGERVCTRCGYVLLDITLNTQPERRSFTYDETQVRERTGRPATLTMHDMGISSSIDIRNKDARGRILSSQERHSANRLRKWDRRVKRSGSVERNLTEALSEITRISKVLNIPKIVTETASHIYRQAIREGHTKGRSIKDVASASIYLACRKCQVPRSMKLYPYQT